VRDDAPLRDEDSHIIAHIFGVYDGHGGADCVDYIKQNLHKTIIAQADFSIFISLLFPLRFLLDLFLLIINNLFDSCA
jgi:serine/threonine protein phosphatase PrpC